MGSLEEESLNQMVHDFIESEPPPSPNHLMLSSPSHSPSFNFILQGILGSESESESEVEAKILKCVLKHMTSKKETERTSSSLKKSLVLRLIMDGFINASLCHSSWGSALGCPCGDYEYIDIAMIDPDESRVGSRMARRRVIVDIDFRSQFEVARPTATYKDLTDTLPQVFVGGEKKLRNIISTLCSAAKQSLSDSGLHIPPWRTIAYMQSKWLSPHCRRLVSSESRKEEEEEEEEEITAGGGGLGAVAVVPTKWTPPMVKPKRRSENFVGWSALSSQFSNLGTQCY